MTSFGTVTSLGVGSGFDLQQMLEDFREIGPTVIVTSSRFWEDLASKIRVKINDAGEFAFFKSVCPK